MEDVCVFDGEKKDRDSAVQTAGTLPFLLFTGVLFTAA